MSIVLGTGFAPPPSRGVRAAALEGVRALAADRGHREQAGNAATPNCYQRRDRLAALLIEGMRAADRPAVPRTCRTSRSVTAAEGCSSAMSRAPLPRGDFCTSGGGGRLLSDACRSPHDPPPVEAPPGPTRASRTAVSTLRVAVPLAEGVTTERGGRAARPQPLVVCDDGGHDRCVLLDGLAERPASSHSVLVGPCGAGGAESFVPRGPLISRSLLCTAVQARVHLRVSAATATDALRWRRVSALGAVA